MRKKRSVQCFFSDALKVLVLAVAGLVLGPVAEGAAAVTEVIHVRGDAEGGDCGRVGIWNDASKTCTLTADFHGKFVIDGDGITLDGAGHTVTGTGPVNPADFRPGPDGGGDGVYVSGRTGVTVKNLTLTRFDYSVNLVGSTGTTVTGIDSSYAGLAGISLSYASNNTITGNSIANAGVNTGICIGYQSAGNLVAGNSVSGSDRGIYLHTHCDRNLVASNILTGNTWGLTLFDFDVDNVLEGNTVTAAARGIYINNNSHNAVVRNNTVRANGTGIRLENVTGSYIHSNNFRDNSIQAQAIGGGANSFEQAFPGGGNYWSDFDSPAEGCDDGNGDGFCDAAYLFAGGLDSRPWTGEDEWAAGRPSLVLGIPRPFWSSYGDYQSRLLSLTWTVNNNGGNVARDVWIMASSCTNGVSAATHLPAPMGTIGASDALSSTLKYDVPQGVAAFSASLEVSAGDTAGGIYYYPPTFERES